MKAFYSNRIFRFFILFVFTSGQLASFGQDVLLKTQADVDAFDPVITMINGDLRIGYTNSLQSDITDLSNLSNIASVDGEVWIFNNDNLINVDGLSSLITIGSELRIENNANLIDVNG